jgi:hypothetical protein
MFHNPPGALNGTQGDLMSLNSFHSEYLESSATPLTLLTQHELDEEAHCRRGAAIHECGHALVARHYGMDAHPFIWPNTGDNRAKEKLWLGRCVYGCIGLTSLRDRHICLAGIVADNMAEGESLDDVDEYDLREILRDAMAVGPDETDGLSRSDWEGVQGWTLRDLRSVQRILKRGWKPLLEEADLLILRGVEDYLMGLKAE